MSFRVCSSVLSLLLCVFKSFFAYLSLCSALFFLPVCSSCLCFFLSCVVLDCNFLSSVLCVYFFVCLYFFFWFVTFFLSFVSCCFLSPSFFLYVFLLSFLLSFFLSFSLSFFSYLFFLSNRSFFCFLF